MFNQSNSSDDMKKDLSKLLKEESNFVKELSDVAAKAAGFHARLESIEKAIESGYSYSSKEADELVHKAQDKYTDELEERMKAVATERMKNY